MHTHLPALERALGLPELQTLVERYLSVRDLGRCCQVSRFFHTLWNRTLWSKIRTGRLGLPAFLDTYCQWVESWERTSTASGYAFLDEMEQVRTSCCYLKKVNISLPVSDPCGFLRHFMGLTEEGVEEGGAKLVGGMQEYGYFRLFIPGRVVFLENDDKDGTLTRQWIQDQEYLQPPRQFIPEFSHPEDAPLAPGLPNAFLSNCLRVLELSSPKTNLPLLDWLTRAAIEGHLQGLEQFMFRTIDLRRLEEGWNTSRSSILQFLGACPRLVVYDAPHVVVKGDESRAFLNADMATAYPTGPWKASHFQAKGGSWRKMIALQELCLASIDFHFLVDEESEDMDGNAIYTKKDRLLLEFFLHLPRLVRLEVNDDIADEFLVQALELAYHPSCLRPREGSDILDSLDPKRPVPEFPPCEGSPARFFSDQDLGSGKDPNLGYYRLEHFRNLDVFNVYERLGNPFVGQPMHRSWERFVKFPWLRLSKLEFSPLHLYNLPENFLEILSGQESIRRHLKSLVIAEDQNPGLGPSSSEDFLHHFRARTISRLLRSCCELREIKVPMTDMAQSGFFTVEESDLWSRSLTGGGGFEERTGCRDKLEVIKISGVQLDEGDGGSVVENEAFREWMASLKSLRSLVIQGVGIRLEGLIDLSLSSPSSPSSEREESICGQLKELQLFIIGWDTCLKVEHVQQLARRMPKLRILSLPGAEESFEPEAEDWIENCCPRLSAYVGDEDEEQD